MPIFPVAQSPARYARIAAGFYLATIVTGAMAVASTSAGTTLNLISTACYVVVTLLFYELFKPVDRQRSSAAAFFGLFGCAWTVLRSAGLAPTPVSALTFFGVYCLL